MISFSDFFKDLCANYVWYERAIMNHKPETFKKVCDDVYTIHSADQNRPFPPIEESRRFVSNKLNKINPDKVKVDWVTKALEKHEEEKQAEWIPVTGEERQRRLAEFKAMIDAAPMVNAMPPPSYKEIIEQGGVVPPKAAPYPITTPEEAYITDRHFEWIKASFEPRIYPPQRLPNSLDECDFNLQYDFENYDAHVKKFKEWYKEHLNGKGL